MTDICEHGSLRRKCDSCAVLAADQRILQLEAALRKIVDGPPAGMKFEDAGGPFEKFACEVACEALRNPPNK